MNGYGATFNLVTRNGLPEVLEHAERLTLKHQIIVVTQT